MVLQDIQINSDESEVPADVFGNPYHQSELGGRTVRSADCFFDYGSVNPVAGSRVERTLVLFEASNVTLYKLHGTVNHVELPIFGDSPSSSRRTTAV